MTPLRQAFDWGRLSGLRLRALSVSEGVYAGGHRSPRRGAGIEFAGHRNYVPGDDLRFIDRHAMMRHGEPVVREFETETDRTLCLLVDASASMAFRSETAPGPKYAYAALIAAALTRVAVTSGDRVSLDWIGGVKTAALITSGGRETFERIVGALESAEPSGDLRADPAVFERAVARVRRRAGRGASVVVLSDLLDLPDGALNAVTSLGALGKTLAVVRVLDPVEHNFPFAGPLHFRAVEGDYRVETDASLVRDAYLEALELLAQSWSERLLAHGGRLLRAETTSDPIGVVRGTIDALGGRRR